MTMKRTIALVFLLAACGGGAKKKPETLIEPDQASESCCCRIEGDDPDDPTFTRAAVMECSSRHGTCLKTESTPDSGALPPAVDETPNSF